jgi:hypothetical protein
MTVPQKISDLYCETNPLIPPSTAGLFPLRGPGCAAVAYGSMIYSILTFYWGVPSTFGFLLVRAGSKEVLLRLGPFFFSTPAGTHPAGHFPAGLTLESFLGFFSRVAAAFVQTERVSFLDFFLVSYQLYFPLVDIATKTTKMTKPILYNI